MAKKSGRCDLRGYVQALFCRRHHQARKNHREWLSVRCATLNRDIATSPKN
jgi:hypothetical protein